MAFEAYVRSLETVTAFKYLWRFLVASYDEWKVVVTNLRKVYNWWAWISRIIGWEESDPRTSGNLYKAVVQATLLFVAENWVVYPRIRKTLGRFHHRVALRMILMRLRQDSKVRWFYPPLEAAMTEVGLREVETYVLRRQNTAAHYIETRPILDICLAVEQQPGAHVTRQWWDQAGLDLGQEAWRESEKTEELEA